MRTAILLPAWVALASAQLLSPGQLAAIPEPVVQVVPAGAGSQILPYDANAAYSAAFNSFSSTTPSRRRKRAAFEKRTEPNCEVQQLGSGPVADPDTDVAFLASTTLSQIALGATTPSGWTQSFQNQQGAVSTSGYMGFKTYSTYDPAVCAAECLASNGCQSFNIFFERIPTLNAAAGCQDPPSSTAIKCSFWGVAISAATLTNRGQYTQNFHVVIAGSNGYQLAYPSYITPGFNGTFTGASTINAPNECDSYITYKSHTGTYDPNLCAADCAAQRLETNPFKGLKCRFFASYQLVKNGEVQAQICSLYSRTWDATYAVNTGYFNGDDVYTIASAFSYTFLADIGSFSCGTTQSTTTSTTTSAAPTTTVALSSTTPVLSSSSTTASSVSTTRSSASSTTTPCTTTTRASTTMSTSTTSSAATQPTAPTNIKNCPSGNNYITANNGQLYNSCPNSDYKIPSPTWNWNVPSVQACANICENCANCVKAVYDPISRVCWSKGNPSDVASNWDDPIWFTIPNLVAIKKVADGTPITSCPSAGTDISNTCTLTKRWFFNWFTTPAPPRTQTSSFRLCPKTDYQFSSPDIWYSVANEQDCLSLCQKSGRCTRASYRPDTKICYNKGSGLTAGLNLVVQSKFNTYVKN